MPRFYFIVLKKSVSKFDCCKTIGPKNALNHKTMESITGNTNNVVVYLN